MNLDVETRIKLDKFKARPYQAPILDAIENKQYRRVLVVMPRRAGKDVTAFNLMVRQAIKVIGVYYYVFPTYSQAKKVIWDSITNSGERFLSYIPDELIAKQNTQEMKIVLVNNSIIQLVGSDNIDSLVGTNPRGVVFSEYALQSPLAYQFLRPILLANDGWALFISTPRGRNHMYELYEIAKNSKDWWCCHLSVLDTKHIPLEEIEKERHEGIMSEDLILQEYYCFPGDTGILTPTGVTEIKDIKIGDVVISHAGRARRVLGVSEREYTGELVEVSSYGSCENITCTPDHPIRVYDSRSQTYQWTKAKDIRKGDRVTFPKLSQTSGSFCPISHELLMIMAWYITEGSTFNNGVQFTVGNKTERDRIAHLLTCLNMPYTVYDSESTFNIVVNNCALLSFLSYNCGSLAHNKKIPLTLISGREKAFIEELIKGDGCVSVRNNNIRYCYTTTSKSLAYQVQIIANSLNEGYAAGITMRPACKSIIEGREVYCRDKYTVNISFKTLRADTWLIRAKYCIAAKVKSVSKIPYTGKVYNLNVKYDNSYIANGRAVHNCDFHVGIEGAYYSKYINKMYLSGQIGNVPWETNFMVNTAWDLGIRDSTSIIFYQIIGNTVRIIDCYENSKEGLEHYITIIKEKPYIYNKHFAPHDIRVRDLSLGITRWEKARQLGVTFLTADRIPVQDGIEAVRSMLSKTWIDEHNCSTLIRALENYRQEYDAKKRVYKPRPLHNEFSHMADAMRYLAVSLPKTADSLTSREREMNYRSAMYGKNQDLPPFFTD